MTFRPLRDVARGFRARERPSERWISQLSGYRPDWNAYRVFSDSPDGLAEVDRAVEAGRAISPMAGLTVSVKDVFGVRGFDSFGGTGRALPSYYEREGALVARMRAFGAAFTGKTHTVEFAFGAIGRNDHWATPANPRASAVVPGGSSSGAPASLLDGTADLALGTDTAGSVRIPASFCGIVGIKPSLGRWATDGLLPLSPTLDTPGLLARTVDDLLFGFSAVEGYWAEDRAEAPTALQRLPAFYEDAEPAVAEQVDAALERLSASGPRLSDARAPEVGAALRLFGIGTVTGAECHAYLSRRLPSWLRDAGPLVGPRIEAGAALSAAEYLRRRARIESLRRRARNLPPGVVWVGPTTPITAPSHDRVGADYRRLNLLALRNNSVANTLGHCAVSVPCGLANGLPVGLMLMAPPGADHWLLRVARWVEQVLSVELPIP